MKNNKLFFVILSMMMFISFVYLHQKNESPEKAHRKAQVNKEITSEQYKTLTLMLKSDIVDDSNRKRFKRFLSDGKITNKEFKYFKDSYDEMLLLKHQTRY